MSSVVYVVRSSLHTISQSLCPEQGSVLMISLKDSLLPGTVISTSKEFPLEDGEQLSYEQLMAVLVKSEKVVTL
ncbi:MAG: hypothetical protein H8K03_11820 [Nitrospira sp.]|jgi:hypothetical protein|nr:hypothetical protein [Nitrospira sp. BO4]